MWFLLSWSAVFMRVDCMNLMKGVHLIAWRLTLSFLFSFYPNQYVLLWAIAFLFFIHFWVFLFKNCWILYDSLSSDTVYLFRQRRLKKVFIWVLNLRSSCFVRKDVNLVFHSLSMWKDYLCWLTKLSLSFSTTFCVSVSTCTVLPLKKKKKRNCATQQAS